jgi:hypothetical protein
MQIFYSVCLELRNWSNIRSATDGGKKSANCDLCRYFIQFFLSCGTGQIYAQHFKCCLHLGNNTLKIAFLTCVQVLFMWIDTFFYPDGIKILAFFFVWKNNRICLIKKTEKIVNPVFFTRLLKGVRLIFCTFP